MNPDGSSPKETNLEDRPLIWCEQSESDSVYEDSSNLLLDEPNHGELPCCRSAEISSITESDEPIKIPLRQTKKNQTVSSESNLYLRKKIIALGMLNLALFSANANQLQNVVDNPKSHPYYYANVSLISFSFICLVCIKCVTCPNFQDFF